MAALHLLSAFILVGLAAGAAVPESSDKLATLIKLGRPDSLKIQSNFNEDAIVQPVDVVNTAMGCPLGCSLLTSCSSRTNSLTVSISGTRVQSPSSSNALSRTSCQIHLKRPSSDICQVRLDFIDFDMSGPNEDGECATDFMTITGAENLQRQFVICGKNVNQHLYLQYGTRDIITLTISSNTITAKYDFLARFIQCSEDYEDNSGLVIERAPDGCAQYFTQASGIVQSFNYAGNMDQSGDLPSGQYQTNSQRYTICFKSESGVTSLKLSPCTSSSPFCISGTPGDGCNSGTVTGNNCTRDYVDIPGSLKGRYCGCSFPYSVSTSSKPFLLFVEFNDHETPQPGDIFNPVTGCPIGWDCFDGYGAPVMAVCDPCLNYICSPPEFFSDSTDSSNTGFCLKYMVS